MKYYGDMPAEHVDLVKQLQALEDWFTKQGEGIPALSASKGFVAMAHDYYTLYMEEEGDRLIDMAEDSYPGYFEGSIHYHMDKDSDYKKLVKALESSLGFGLMLSYGYRK